MTPENALTLTLMLVLTVGVTYLSHLWEKVRRAVLLQGRPPWIEGLYGV